MYGTDYPLPLALVSNTPRLIGIDGNEKMGKSLGNTIYMTAELKEITTQVNKMYTDPGKTSIQSPGNIENHVVFKYLDIFYEDKEYLEKLKNQYIAGGENSIGDGTIKKLLIETLNKIITPIRERRSYYLEHMDIVIDAMER